MFIALIQIPLFWRDTILSNQWLGNRIWDWLIALVLLTLYFPLSALIVKLFLTLTGKWHKIHFVAKKLVSFLKVLLATVIISLVFQTGLLHLSDPLPGLAQRVIDTLKAVSLCLLVAAVASGLIDLHLERLKAQENKQGHTVFNFYRTLIYIGVILLAAFMILGIWGFDITGLVAGLGVGGLAISLAAQDTFSNLLGGLTIMTDHSFAIGDVISSPDVEGVVEEIRFRSTKVRTFNQFLVTVPNKKLSNDSVTNLSRVEKRRIRFHIPLEYGTTSDEIRTLIARLKSQLSARPAVAPASVLIYLDRLGESSVDILFQCYVEIVDFTLFASEQESILLEVMDTLQAEDIRFAYPTLSIHRQKAGQEDR